jgi:hypothetical protein
LAVVNGGHNCGNGTDKEAAADRNFHSVSS